MSASNGALPAFPLELLPEAARGYCEFLAEGGLPPEFLGPSALTIMAAALGGLVSLQIGEGYWDEPLQIWTLTVGLTGSGKSPAVKNLRRALDGVETPWRLQHAKQVEDWQLLPARERKEVPRPVARRLTIADATYEKTIRLLAEEQNAAGLLLIADEFASFVRGLNQYKNGSGADRANFLTIWTSQPLSFDRVSDNLQLWIQHPVVNILGGTQPHLLTALTGDDGFRDRFLISLYEKPINDQVPDLVKAKGEEERWRLLVTRLAAGRCQPRTRTLSDEARALWTRQRKQYISIQNDPSTPRHLVNWTAKAASHLARLALLLSEVDGRAEVDATYLGRAAKLVSYFGAHYRHLPLDDPDPMLPHHRQGEDRAVRDIEAFLRRRADHKASRRDLQRAMVGGIRTGEGLDDAIKRYEATHEYHVFKEGVAGGLKTILYAPGHSPEAPPDES